MHWLFLLILKTEFIKEIEKKKFYLTIYQNKTSQLKLCTNINWAYL